MSRPRRLLAAVALPALLLPACTAGGEQEAVPADDAVEVVVDAGDDRVVGTAPVSVSVGAGGTVRIRNGNRGSSATHLFTSAPPDEGPTLFTPVATGALPNAAVWGPCLGGTADAATRSCPVPPIEGPTAWDGRTYVSLGAQLPGETRELALAEDLVDSGVSLWCRVHPELRVDLRPPAVAAGPPVATPRPPAAPTPAAGRVLVAPADAQGELLAFVPSVTTVRAGGTVTWTVPGTSPHTVELGAEAELEDTGPAEAVPSAPPGGVRPGDLARSGFLSRDPGAPGSTFSLRFLEPGRYRYACRFHPQMTGEVVVTA